MRLIHALVNHDEIKAKFLNGLNLFAGCFTFYDREQLSTANVWHLLAENWNDKKFAQETESMPALNKETAISNIILQSGVVCMTLARAKKVKDKSSLLEIKINCCITSWQKSEQGRGEINDAIENIHDLAILKTSICFVLFSRIGGCN
jgi:hypothetical protein